MQQIEANRQMTKEQVRMEKVIFSKRIAIELRKNGFRIIRVEPNRSKPQYDCYVFEYTEALQKELDRIFK